MDSRGASVLTDFVLDASATMVLVMDDEPEGPVMPIVHALAAGDPLVPMLWDFEVASALMLARRTGRLDDEELARSMHTIGVMGCERDREPPDIALLIATADAHGLTAYDASYLALALRRGVPLATVDRALVRAAEECGVPLVC